MARYRNKSNHEQVIELFCDQENGRFKFRKPAWLSVEATRRIGFAWASERAMLRAFAENNVHLEPVPTQSIDEALVSVPLTPARDERTYRSPPATVADLIRALSKLPQDARVMVASDVDDTDPNDVTDLDLDTLGERFVLENALPSASLRVVPDGDDPTAYHPKDDGTAVSKAVVLRRRYVGDCISWRRS